MMTLTRLMAAERRQELLRLAAERRQRPAGRLGPQLRRLAARLRRPEPVAAQAPAVAEVGEPDADRGLAARPLRP